MKKNTLKHILTLTLALLLWTGLSATASAADTGYADVPAGHWAAESVERATSLGIFRGVSEGRFGLGQPISRAEFVTALVRLFGWDAASPQRPTFTDVPADAWYAQAVETARANSAVAAAGKEFYPEEAVTRSDMASMLLRSLGYTYLAGTAAEYSAPFNDVTVNRGFITLAYDLELMNGTAERRFDPDAPATREQAATVLVRVYDRLALRAAPVMDDASEYRTISLSVPMAQEGAEMPITPLEPLTDLYATLRRMKYNGSLDQAALRLTAGGVLTITDGDGRILSSSTLTPDQVQESLTQPDAKTYYSDQYESAYCIYYPDEAHMATLWYQSEESMAAKLQLAKLFGVTRYVLE